jgi:hypothetical protein
MGSTIYGYFDGKILLCKRSKTVNEKNDYKLPIKEKTA